MEKILVVDEKHEHRYFDASSQDLIDKTLIKLFIERMSKGWYDWQEDNIYDMLGPSILKTIKKHGSIDLDDQEVIDQIKYFMWKRSEDFANEGETYQIVKLERI